MVLNIDDALFFLSIFPRQNKCGVIDVPIGAGKTLQLRISRNDAGKYTISPFDFSAKDVVQDLVDKYNTQATVDAHKMLLTWMETPRIFPKYI